MNDMRNGICPLCGHGEVVAARALRDSRQFLLAAVTARQGKHSLEPIDPIGAFLACICRSCGYTQFFTWNPENIPVGQEYGTELLPGPGPSGATA
jgi:hypothetical protein